jgi:glycosyltransferase involved in cell wall biosynthesis
VLHIASVRWWSALAYYALALAQGLERLGVPGGIVAAPGSPLEERAAPLRLVRPEWQGLISRRPDRVLRSAERLRAAVRGGRISAVVVHTGDGHLASALALRGGPAPLLRARPEIRRPSNGPASSWLHAGASDRVLIPGDFMRRGFLERLRIDERKIVVLPAGIDLDPARAIERRSARSRLRAAHGWDPEAPVVGMLARYSPVKGHRDLVRAVRILADRYPAARFLTAGPEGQTGRERVRAWIAEAGIADRFFALDAVADPLEAAAGFDVAVIASTDSEAVCRSALEYMALGVPIVATRVHVIPETVGDAGILIPAGAPEDLAQAIASLLDDPARAAELGRIGLLRVRERFDLPVIGERALAIIEDARRERMGHVG